MRATTGRWARAGACSVLLLAAAVFGLWVVANRPVVASAAQGTQSGPSSTAVQQTTPPPTEPPPTAAPTTASPPATSPSTALTSPTTASPPSTGVPAVTVPQNTPVTQPAYTAPIVTSPQNGSGSNSYVPPPTSPPPSTTTTTLALLNGHLPSTPATVPLTTKGTSAHVSPAFAIASGAGFLIAILIASGRFVMTRPGKAGRR